MSQLKLYLLGPLRIERNGQTVEVETRKASALLAYLALHPERLSRDQLAALLWPEYDQERAYANLRRTLWALNKALGEGWLTADNLSLELRQQEALWVDVLAFQHLLAQCRTHRHRSDEVCPACLEPLAQAVNLVRGDFLEGFSLRDSASFDDWQFFEAESLRKQLAGSLEKLVRGHSAQQEDETAIGYARRWLALDPLHEPVHRWLMQLYAWTGQPSTAARQYQECVRVLQAELDAPPEAETTALYTQIRAGEVSKHTVQMTRGSDPSQTSSMVSHSIAPSILEKELTVSPIGALVAQTPPPFMAPALPPQGILGREDVLAQIFQLLHLDQHDAMNIPPVALQGMGGIGKTTLAIAFSRLESPLRLFPDGVLWASVGPQPTIRNLLDSWGRALGLNLTSERDEDACGERLRAWLHQRRVLLIVDDLWEVNHGQKFMVAGPACRTLVTTREAPVAYSLATRERTVRVDLLQPSAALKLLYRLAPEAVTTDEPSARRLCERLEYLPLALTLAGKLLANEADIPSRLQRLVSELIERRASRLHLLQAEGRPGFDQAEPISLQAILGMSVERLSRIDQERFALLAIFGAEPLTWETQAAAYVWECSVEEAEATIMHFIQRALVMRRGESYWMHALLADYAAELLQTMN